MPVSVTSSCGVFINEAGGAVSPPSRFAGHWKSCGEWVLGEVSCKSQAFVVNRKCKMVEVIVSVPLTASFCGDSVFIGRQPFPQSLLAIGVEMGMGGWNSVWENDEEDPCLARWVISYSARVSSGDLPKNKKLSEALRLACEEIASWYQVTKPAPIARRILGD